MQRASIIAFALLSASGCSRDTDRVAPDTTRIEGVSARFEVASVARRGKSLKVTAIYRNESDKTVVFRCSISPINHAEIWRGSTDKTYCLLVPEIPIVELTLKPGEERRMPDEQPFGACYEPGDYEIRFYYPLGLLADPQIRAHYASTHPVLAVYNAIRWETHGHHFTVK
jgi:hypothetical protein